MEPWQRYESLVDNADAFRRACQQPLPTAVRVNPIKTTPSSVKELLDREGVPAVQQSWNENAFILDTESPGRTWAYQHGWIHGQEEISQHPAIVLDPDPGDVVWDAAAAPGGKATQLAAMVREDGFVVANDANLGRLSSMRSNADRLGVDNLIVTHEDARRYPFEPVPVDVFDHALVDAPCSGEGTVRKNPAVIEQWDEDSLSHLAAVQVGILRRAIELTRSGGTVIYSTCTFAPEENEGVLDRILDQGNVEIEPYDTPLVHNPGVTKWRDDTYDVRLRHAKRFYPHLNDTGGFFCAKLRVAQ